MADFPRITDFFKKKKNLQNTPVIRDNDDDEDTPVEPSISDKFSKKCLDQQKKCDKIHCFKAKSALEDQIKQIQLKCQNNKEAIETCSAIISQKQSEIDALRKVIETLNHSTESCNVIPTSTSTSESTSKAVSAEVESLKFIELTTHFTESQLAELRTFGKNKVAEKKRR